MPAEFDTTTPHSPRVWNYWLGGKDNYEVDREVGEQVRRSTPQIVDLARTSRAFLVRAVEHLAGERGVRQFLDIGTGLPTADNTHEVAQRVNPEARIVYVDNDPMVLAHARVLSTSSSQGATRYLDADVTDPHAVLASTRDEGILDFDEPIALILMNIVGHIADWDQARGIVATLLDALPAGSYLVESDGTNVIDPVAMDNAARIYNTTADPRYHLRTPDQLTQLFAGLDLVEPGVVSCPLWRPAPAQIGVQHEIDQFGGVGRKP